MKFDVAIKIDRAITRLEKLPDDVRAALKEEINGLATTLRARSQANAATFFHVRSGEFQRSIKKSVRSSKTSVVGKVFSRSPVAHLLERGVKPHDIRPKNAKALAFLGRFAEVIHHPGFQGHTIINAAFQDMKAEITEGIGNAVTDALQASQATAG